jgi:hypothetical protein
VIYLVNVKEDLTGQHIHKFTILEQTDDYVTPKGVRIARWLCQCDCGSDPIKVTGNSLKTGSVKSCGCSRRKHNKYDLSGEYGIGWTSNTNKEFYFDLEDYDKIKDYCWREIIHKKTGHNEVVAQSRDKKTIRIHWVIYGKYYDHADRNTFNNRKNNLRKASYTENARNYSKLKNNTSGFSGISWDKSRSQWVAYITINKKRKKIGRFVNKYDAIIARLQAEAEYFGEFAPQRHLFEEYNIIYEG